MELGQIKYFILVARLQNMSKAAQALGIAQPTLSRSITGLERELGTQLFDRSGKKLTLNERGKHFLESAQRAVDELDNAVASAKGGLADSTVTIGLFCMSERLVRCLGAFTREHPEVTVNISYLNGAGAHVDTNEFDVLLYPQGALRYKGQYAYTESLILAVNKDSSLAERTGVSLSELAGHRLVIIKNDVIGLNSVYPLYLNKISEHGGQSVCNSIELQRLMISSAQGIGIVPHGAAGLYQGDDNIKLIAVTDEGLEREVFIGFKREKHLSDYGRLAMAFISDWFNLEKQS